MKKVLLIKDPENATLEIIVEDVVIFSGNYYDFKLEFDLIDVLKNVSDLTVLIKRGIS